MGGFSNQAEDDLLQHQFKIAAYTQPTNLYVTLSTATLDDTEDGNPLTGELSGGGFARKQCNTWQTHSTPGMVSNAIALNFGTANADHTTVTHFAVTDHASTGDVRGWAALTTPRKILSGDSMQFSVGELVVTLD